MIGVKRGNNRRWECGGGVAIVNGGIWRLFVKYMKQLRIQRSLKTTPRSYHLLTERKHQQMMSNGAKLR